MNDCLLNVRIRVWHFQITKDWKFRISRNEYHKGNPEGSFAIYTLWGLR